MPTLLFFTPAHNAHRSSPPICASSFCSSDQGLPGIPAAKEDRSTSIVGRRALSALAGIRHDILRISFAQHRNWDPASSAWTSLSTGRGGLYLLHTLDTDPVTLLVLAGGIMAAASRSRCGIIHGFGAGLLAQLVYIVSVGGDFVGTRFLRVPFFVAALVVSTAKGSEKTFWHAIVLVGILGMLNPYNPVRANGTYTGYGVTPNGIADERGYCFKELGLLRTGRGAPQYQEFKHFKTGLALRQAAEAGASRVVVAQARSPRVRGGSYCTYYRPPCIGRSAPVQIVRKTRMADRTLQTGNPDRLPGVRTDGAKCYLPVGNPDVLSTPSAPYVPSPVFHPSSPGNLAVQ